MHLTTFLWIFNLLKNETFLRYQGYALGVWWYDWQGHDVDAPAVALTMRYDWQGHDVDASPAVALTIRYNWQGHDGIIHYISKVIKNMNCRDWVQVLWICFHNPYRCGPLTIGKYGLDQGLNKMILSSKWRYFLTRHSPWPIAQSFKRETLREFCSRTRNHRLVVVVWFHWRWCVACLTDISSMRREVCE